jgi:hypothetical protein
MVTDFETYHKMMELSEFKDQSINGQQSVVTNGAIMNVA